MNTLFKIQTRSTNRSGADCLVEEHIPLDDRAYIAEAVYYIRKCNPNYAHNRHALFKMRVFCDTE